MSKRIAIVGCGNLGNSIVNGLIEGQGVDPSLLIATRRNTESIADIASKGVEVTSDNGTAIEQSDIIIVALKPYTILPTLESLKGSFNPDRHILVSLATGISLDEISGAVEGKASVYRAMPNTGADVGNSMTCIATRTEDAAATETVKDCFNAIGESIVIDESLMDAATVLGACGIAYVLRFMRGMIQGGIQIGFDAQTATDIVSHTVRGAAELLIQNQRHPEHEIDKVTTPRGCTIAGLNEMEHNGFSSALIKGIVTSYEEI